MPKPLRQPSLFAKKPHARLRGEITVTATARTEPDYRRYAEAPIALGKQLQDEKAGSPHPDSATLLPVRAKAIQDH